MRSPTTPISLESREQIMVPFSALNALEYCPRRFYYEHVQAEMFINAFVLEGQLLHQRVDQPAAFAEKGVERIHRLYLCSERLRAAGYLDLLEEEAGKLVPIEYKRGREGRWLNDHIQLCAQALCLEEYLPHLAPLPHGYIFYFGSRHRQQVLCRERIVISSIKQQKRNMIEAKSVDGVRQRDSRGSVSLSPSGPMCWPS
jgi:CRISPR-associated exonuclease Cas4